MEMFACGISNTVYANFFLGSIEDKAVMEWKETLNQCCTNEAQIVNKLENKSLI